MNQLQLDVNVNGVDTKGKYYQLTTDIDLSGYDNDNDETNGNFNPIGYYNSSSDYNYFKGTFDGQGHTISNLEIILPEQSYVGLFGYATSATIQNLGLESVSVEGNLYVGGLTGYQNAGTITQSYSTGNTTGAYYVGGLVGFQYAATIDQSYSAGNATGTEYVGGLVGYQRDYDAAITQSYATGKVRGNSSYVGGLVGYAKSSYNTTGSYWDVESTGQSSSMSGVGLTTEEMTKRKAKTNMTGFDFDAVWQESNGYPLLHWQPVDSIGGGEEEVVINGTIEATILSLTIPSQSTTFVLNPNEEEGQRFIASEFNLVNESRTPLALELRTFEQTTDVLNDVVPTKYPDWNLLNKKESKDIALALVPKVGEGWLSLNEGNRWVANLGNPQIGTIKGNSTVSFGFEAKHGSAFSETLAPQYRLTFIFGLQD